MPNKNDKNDNDIPDWLEKAYSEYMVLEIAKTILYFVGLVFLGFLLTELKGLFGG